MFEWENRENCGSDRKIHIRGQPSRRKRFRHLINNKFKKKNRKEKKKFSISIFFLIPFCLFEIEVCARARVHLFLCVCAPCKGRYDGRTHAAVWKINFQKSTDRAQRIYCEQCSESVHRFIIVDASLSNRFSIFGHWFSISALYDWLYICTNSLLLGESVRKKLLVVSHEFVSFVLIVVMSSTTSIPFKHSNCNNALYVQYNPPKISFPIPNVTRKEYFLITNNHTTITFIDVNFMF